KAVSMRAGEIPEGCERVLYLPNGNFRKRLRRLGDDRPRGAALDRLGEKRMAGEVGTSERHEQCARLQRSRVGRDRLQRDRGACGTEPPETGQSVELGRGEETHGATSAFPARARRTSSRSSKWVFAVPTS